MSLLLLPVKILLILIDTVLMVVTFGWVKALKKALSAPPVRSVAVDPSTPSQRVHVDYTTQRLTKPSENISTLYELAQDSFSRFSNHKCMGSRTLLGMKSEKPPVKHFASDITWRTYDDVRQSSLRFGSALKAHGLVSSPAIGSLDALTTPCSLAIFENTCAEWMIAALGAFSQSVIVTTIYATLGIDAVVDAVQDGVVSAMVCNKTSVNTLLSRIQDMPSLKLIVYTTDGLTPNQQIDFVPIPRGIAVLSFQQFVDSGDLLAFPPTPPPPTSTAVLMYTSGSTGKPKGVVITHSQVIAAIASGKIALGALPGDVYMAYLPLAHILELMAEFCMLSMGATLCYADPKTLSSKGSYPVGALEAFSPTLMAGVPKIWDMLKKGIEAKVNAGSPVKRFLFQTAFEARKFAIAHGYDTPFFNKLIFKKVSAATGGKLRLALSGGGPLNSEVQVFIRTCFGCPLIQGYGLTETNAGLTVQAMDDLRSGIAGVPLPSVEVKLESTPDIKDKRGSPYLSKDTRDVEGNLVYGRGEILVRGPSVSLGYYRMPDKTKEVWEDDGFFHTGDIGQFMEDGSIRIVDRVKNLVKLKGGEYIAIENMEMTYGNSKFVDALAGGICCYGDGDMDRPIALIQLNEFIAKQYAKDHGIPGADDFEQLKQSKELKDAVLADLKNEAKKGGLSHLEHLVAVAFMSEPWTPENGCLTAANKLQRRAVIEMFEKEFLETKAKGIF